MGALARIPSEQFQKIENLLYEEIPESQQSNKLMKELCLNGFYFPSDSDEEEFVSKILDKENKYNFYDL